MHGGRSPPVSAAKAKKASNMQKARSIEGGASLLLDSLRLGAALVVLVGHALDMWFPGGAHDPTLPGNLPHAAVVVFFVLSGHVIAYTSSVRHRRLGDYLEARLSRLCSMVVPALLVTAAVELAVRYQADPNLLNAYVRGAFGPRYAVTGTFMNEVWLFSAAPPANIALWSLSFEFWYYLIFGLWFFTGRGLKSWALALAAGLVAGPKILLMMPIWLMGCAAYWLPRPTLPPRLAWLGVGVALFAALGSIMMAPPWPWPIGSAPFFFANQFVTDWGSGLFIAVALWLVPSPPPEPQRLVPEQLVQRFRSIADLTFPIYVLHFPLLVLWRVLFGTRLEDAVQCTVAVAVVLLVAALAGWQLERRRKSWTRFFRFVFARLPRPFVRTGA